MTMYVNNELGTMRKEVVLAIGIAGGGGGVDPQPLILIFLLPKIFFWAAELKRSR
jgi:hypothetical protein